QGGRPAAVGQLQRQHLGHAAVADRRGELQGRQLQVLGLLTVPVQHRGHLAGPAGTPGGTLTELSTDLRAEGRNGHGCTPVCCGGNRLILPGQLRPPNRVVTDPSSKTSRMARASSGAIESTVILSSCFSGGSGRVLVTTTSLIWLFLSRSVAGSERIAWVAATTTSAAPVRSRISEARQIVPPVSIMSSTIRQTRP